MVRKILVCVILFIFFFMSLVNAETLVVGKIYNSTILIDENSVADASIKVGCYHGNLTYIKETISVSDGTYGVGFNDTECGIGDNVNVTAVKGNLKGSDLGIVHYEAGINISVVNVVIKKIIIEKKHKCCHKKKIEINLCGDFICDSGIGEDEFSCPEDCKVEETVKIKNVPVNIIYSKGYETKVNLGMENLILIIGIVFLLFLILITLIIRKP